MQDKIHGSILKRVIRLLLPIFIGLGVTILMFYNEFKEDAFFKFPISWNYGILILLAIFFMIGRDLSLAWRFRMMCLPEKLKWKSAIKADLLCEFASAATPTTIGGSGFIAIFLRSHGISMDKGIMITIATLFLDEFFFVIACPILFLFLSPAEIFGEKVSINSELTIVFVIVYLCTAIYTILLFISLFYKSDIYAKASRWLFSIKWLRRYLPKVEETLRNMELSALQLRNKSYLFWGKAFLSTAMAWISRYLVACMLFMPFVHGKTMPIIFARQFTMWIVMMVSPTPGGSGVSEYIFSAYYSDIIASTSVILVITVLWRIITFYSYLLLGSALIPGLVRQLKK